MEKSLGDASPPVTPRGGSADPPPSVGSTTGREAVRHDQQSSERPGPDDGRPAVDIQEEAVLSSTGVSLFTKQHSIQPSNWETLYELKVGGFRVNSAQVPTQTAA